MSYIGYHPTELTLGETHTVRPGGLLFDQTIWQYTDMGGELATLFASSIAASLDTLGAVLFVGPDETSGAWVTALLALTCLANLDERNEVKVRCVVLDAVDGNARVLLVSGVGAVQREVDAHDESGDHLEARCSGAMEWLTEQYGIAEV